MSSWVAVVFENFEANRVFVTDTRRELISRLYTEFDDDKKAHIDKLKDGRDNVTFPNFGTNLTTTIHILEDKDYLINTDFH